MLLQRGFCCHLAQQSMLSSSVLIKGLAALQGWQHAHAMPCRQAACWAGHMEEPCVHAGWLAPESAG